jgi:hypothetical protein
MSNEKNVRQQINYHKSLCHSSLPTKNLPCLGKQNLDTRCGDSQLEGIQNSRRSLQTRRTVAQQVKQTLNVVVDIETKFPRRN